MVDRIEDADHRRRQGAALRQVEPVLHAVGIVAEVDLDHGVFRPDVDGHRDLDAVGRRAGKGIVAAAAGDRALRHRPDDVDHALLAVVEPGPRIGFERLPADLAAEREDLALADAGRAEGGEVVAPPLVGDADAHPAHAHEVHVVLVVALDLHRRKDQRALAIDVLGGAHIGRRQGVAAVGLVPLGEHREAVDAVVVDDRHEDRVVGRMGAAVIGRVVEIGVAALQHRMVVGHRPAHDLGAAEHVDRQAVGGGEQFVPGRQDDAGEVAGDGEDARPPGAVEGVGHLAGDAFEAGGEHRHLDTADRRGRELFHLAAPMSGRR